MTDSLLDRCASRLLAVALLLGPASTSARAQGPASAFTPLNVAGVTVSGSLRTRLETWDWFGDDPGTTYTYPGTLLRIGASQVRTSYDWNLEISAPLLFALPVQPAWAGPAGLGANYFVANNRRRTAVGLFAKQGYVRLKRLGSVEGQSLKVGRLEFFDGAEGTPTHETLAALKRDRVAARLLANFGFTHVQRSLDGVQYALDRPTLNVTALAARPTRGVFQVDGWGELNIAVLYGAVTRESGGRSNAAEWRLFGLEYRDARSGVVKVDNRPLAVRQSDLGHVNVATLGGHYMRAVTGERGTMDVLFWGSAQIGSWGDLSQQAGAFAVEAGWQPKAPLSPWIRGGFDYASGDGDPNDTIHGTFFQVLPTPRLYARFPFFNLMNSADVFGALVLRASKRVSSRVDVHSIRVADGNDLWYQGGGAFQQATFGYIGQPVGGRRALATLVDASVDLALSTRLALGVYAAHAAGGPSSALTYQTNNAATLAYAEFLVRF